MFLIYNNKNNIILSVYAKAKAKLKKIGNLFPSILVISFEISVSHISAFYIVFIFVGVVVIVRCGLPTFPCLVSDNLTHVLYSSKIKIP